MKKTDPKQKSRFYTTDNYIASYCRSQLTAKNSGHKAVTVELTSIKFLFYEKLKSHFMEHKTEYTMEKKDKANGITFFSNMCKEIFF